MDEHEWLASRFQEHRGHLRAVAYRMLGSFTEADDAVQDAWIRFSRSGADGVENLGGFLTTIVARVCLNTLRARAARREDSIGVHVPDPIISLADVADPEAEALMADAVGLALIVVLETLSPAERLAFVLHDLFDIPFNEIAPMLDRSPAATRQLASRARRRVHAAESQVPETEPTAQRAVVDAFFAAARHGDFEGLVALLGPDVVLRSDAVFRADGQVTYPEAPTLLLGAAAVARRVIRFAPAAAEVHPVLVNGAAGVVVAGGGRLVTVVGFTIMDGQIAEIDTIANPERLSRLDLASILSDQRSES